ncbi:hypothetical protein NA57DRAFT_32488 [Rhizodiscina lignyota]|uniref:Zn(2)-C6 fungal-type domain-containing protein n=1 Tax=Rhizodiscina lignyota TaxID=1504668 RepID=A0A9P4IM46_9PEZI|nr:hypothetical protein NA57DRAFT_32488 [Rhizodiscina lignyota]
MDTSPLPTPAGADALRESFGDRKPPDITRKITACVACRKQKIKCDMRDSRPPCTRCKRRGLSCTVNRSLQMLLEDDATWKATLAKKVQSLEAAVAELRQNQQSSLLPGPARAEPSTRYRSDEQRSSEASSSAAPGDAPGHWDVVMDEGGPATIPAASVRQVGTSISPTGPVGQQGASDLIVRGIVTLEQAQELFDVYANRLDHFLYDILGEHKNFTKVRTDSPLLLAAACTVGALHSVRLGHVYDRCFQKFLSLCAAQTIAKDTSLADIKGLCIGAFWLSEVSWNLVGIAVRAATQLQLHRSIKLALRGNKRAYYETRLYYLVYTCDHHFSLAYGRPPMTREDESIQSAQRFLATENATEDDHRLVSQVLIWNISSAAFETFGVDVDAPVPLELLPKLRRFMIALDTWRADWNERFSHNRHVQNYPRKGVGLHFNFAKLYLCSHAFRGMTPHGNPHQPVVSGHELQPDMEEIANAAVLSAKSILRAIVNDPEMQLHLNGVPLYFDTMIAFAVVFLLKVATKFSSDIRTSGSEILTLVKDMSLVLRQITTQMHRQHLLRFISEGIEKLLGKVEEASHQHPARTQPYPAADPSVQRNGQPPAQPYYMDNMDFNWLENISNFDFLSTQNTFTALDSWPFGGITLDSTSHVT